MIKKMAASNTNSIPTKIAKSKRFIEALINSADPADKTEAATTTPILMMVSKNKPAVNM